MADWLEQEYEQGLVSVVIPCHNQERFLRDCMQSLIGQYYRPLEAIVVDDGSSDGTGRLMEEFENLRHDGLAVKCIRQSRQGAQYARNQACRQARGEFIQYLDGDDMLCSDKISRQVNLLNNDRAVDVAYGDGQYLVDFGGSTEQGKIISMGPASDIVEAMLSGLWVPVFSYLCRRSAVQRCGPWDRTVAINQDYEYFLRVATLRCRFQYLSGNTGFYRKHSFGTISEQSLTLRAATRLRILADAESRLRDLGEFHANRVGAMVENYRRVAREMYSMDTDLFDGIIDNVLRLCPDYLPKSTGARLVSRVIGVRNYERAAAALRQRMRGRGTSWS